MRINFIAIFALLIQFSCSFFGEKNKVEDYIDKPDYSLKGVEYVPVLPVVGSGITPVSIYFGYDEILYAVDSAKAIVSYDAAGNQLGRFELPNVHFVIQNRSLDLYALGRMDTFFQGRNFNLPVIYKITQKVTGNENTDLMLNLNAARVIKKMVYPFCINEVQKLKYPAEVQAIELGAIGFLDNNSYYVTSRGPQEITTDFITRRNSVLTFSNKDIFAGGFTEGSASESISVVGLTTLVHPPQRARMDIRKDFLYTSFSENLGINVRYIEVLILPEGEFTNFKILSAPSEQESDGSIYGTFRFKKPGAITFGGTSQRLIFVADQEKDSVYVFQENGYEGVNPPPQYTNKRLINVSFGGFGSGPKQFNRPSGIAFFNNTLYIADAGNKRISRFKLTSDFD